MDKIEGGASYQQPKFRDVFAGDSDNEDYVYSTESSDEDDVDEIKTSGQQKEIVIGGDVEKVYDIDDDNIVQDDGLDREEKKKRKLETLLSRYQLAPRPVVNPPVSKPSRGRNSLTDWTEKESFVLLQAWGERYLKHGRKNVREWYEVAQKVSEGPKIKRTETQCRNRLDTLKKRYKKEKAMLAENVGATSQWVFFNKMDMILSPSSSIENGYVSVEPKGDPNQVSNREKGIVLVEQKIIPKHYSNLANGFVSVEQKVDANQEKGIVLVEQKVEPKHDLNLVKGYVSVEPNQVSNQESGIVLVEQKVDQNHDSKLANGYVLAEPKVNSGNASSSDEMKDDNLVGDSEFAAKEVRENKEDVPSKRAKMGRGGGMGDAFKLLADSIDKFRETFERVQSEKSEKLVEMEKMKMKFRSDMEIERGKIMKKAHVEIAKLWGLTSKDLEDPLFGNASG